MELIERLYANLVHGYWKLIPGIFNIRPSRDNIYGVIQSILNFLKHYLWFRNWFLYNHGNEIDKQVGHGPRVLVVNMKVIFGFHPCWGHLGAHSQHIYQFLQATAIDKSGESLDNWGHAYSWCLGAFFWIFIYNVKRAAQRAKRIVLLFIFWITCSQQCWHW